MNPDLDFPYQNTLLRFFLTHLHAYLINTVNTTQNGTAYASATTWHQMQLRFDFKPCGGAVVARLAFRTRSHVGADSAAGNRRQKRAFGCRRQLVRRAAPGLPVHQTSHSAGTQTARLSSTSHEQHSLRSRSRPLKHTAARYIGIITARRVRTKLNFDKWQYKC